MSALPDGTILNGQYEIKALLGMGGFGITYRGYDRFLNVDVAIKEFFLPTLATRNVFSGDLKLNFKSISTENTFKEEIRKFELEANRISKLNGLPGIIKIYNFFYENNTAYMVMDFIEGITLRKYRYDKGGKLPWDEVITMLRPVITSLSTVHEAGIIHRDISPDNIMLGGDKEVTLIDFGAARYSDAEIDKTVVLKKNFAPPEQYYKDGDQGPWSDVYALCATIYLLITGVLVPDAMSRLDGIYEIKPISEYIPDIPKNVDSAIMKGLELSIQDRICSTAELEKRLSHEIKEQKRFINRLSTRLAITGMAAGIILLFVGVLLKNGETIMGMVNNNEITSATGESSVETSAPDETAKKTEETQISNETVDDEINTEDTGYQSEEIPELFSNCERPDDSWIVYTDSGNETLRISEINAKSVNIIVPSKVNGKNVEYLQFTNINAAKVYIENGIEVIENGAFSGCLYLEYVYIPGSVKEITSNAFSNCISLKGIVVSENNDSFYTKENALYDSQGNVIIEWNQND